jgi:hypothetical protein
MPHYRFPKFTEDSRVSAEMEQYWQDLWERVIQLAPDGWRWTTPWMKNPQADGNPIFTAVCPDLHRGVRIIQEQVPGLGESDCDFWTDYFGEISDPEAIRELVIACCPSRENEQKVEKMLRRWVQQGNVGIDIPVTKCWGIATDTFSYEPLCA